MNDKILNLLGLCRRAGKIVIGNDPVIDSILHHKARLIITANDLSQRTQKGIIMAASQNNVKVLQLNRSKDQMGDALGKYCAVVSIEDNGFAKKLIQLIQADTQQEESVYDKIQNS